MDKERNVGKMSKRREWGREKKKEINARKSRRRNR